MKLLLQWVRVYHVAHPDVMGLVLPLPRKEWTKVWFTKPVSFNGNNSGQYNRRYWTCTTNLLWPTSREAQVARKY